MAKKNIQAVIYFDNSAEFEEWQANHDGCPEIIISVFSISSRGIGVVYWKVKDDFKPSDQ